VRHWAGLALALAAPAFAARPLTNEDASVLEDKRCQVEAWVDRARDSSSQAWLVPACNFGAGIEWQAGAARSREGGASRFSEAYAQGKALLRPVEDAGWSVGLVAGITRRPLNERHRGWHNPYVTVPVSIALGNALVHVNGGWSRDREADRGVTTWGIAAEAPLLPQITVVAEAWGQNSERPYLRAGGRMILVKDSLDIDLTVVTRPGGTRAERYVSLGVFWQSGRFLP